MIFARRQYLSALFVAVVGIFSVSAGFARASDIRSHIANLEKSEGIKAAFDLHPATGAIRMLKSGDGKPVFSNRQADASPESASRAFVNRHGKLFGIASDKEYLAKKTSRDKKGNSYVRFQQRQQGLPVIAAEFVVHSDPSHNVMSMLGKTSLKTVLNSTPSVPQAAALDAALRATAEYHDVGAATLVGNQPLLSIYNPSLLDSYAENSSVLVWQIEVTSKTLAPIRQFVLVNATSGSIALSFNQIHRLKDRVVYDKNNIRSEIVPNMPETRGEMKRSEGQDPSNIADVDHAYQYSGDTYDYYFTMFDRDGIDGSGMQIVNSVRYCSTDKLEACPYQNAFWDGQQMVYGDGYPAAPDVVAHELTHGITDRTSGLFYYMQSGAINESFSDLWGEFVQQKYHPSSAADRWLIGENLRGSLGGPFRSMKDPPSFSDPDRITNPLYKYKCGSGSSDSDSGGVHTNSGINNKAVYLMTDGGLFNGRNITGIGADKVSHLYYYVQTNLLTSGSDYADLNNALQMACGTLSLDGTNGFTSSDCQQVKNALDAVEMNLPPANCPAPEAPVCSANEIPVDLFFDDFENGLANWVTTTDSATATTIWTLDSQYAKRGANNTSNSLYGKDIDSKSDTSAAMAAAITLPANAYMHFEHAYEFEYSSNTGEVHDGGVVEYSLDKGSTWLDAGSLITHNGYGNKTIYSDPLDGDNALTGKRAFSAISNGYISSRLNLASLSGKSARFRFRISTDTGNAAFTPPEYPFGWVIDNFRIYTCRSVLPGAPTIGAVIAGNAQATVNFSAPLSDGGSAITGYTATSSPDGISGTGSSSPILVTGLTNGTAYTFTVAATNSSGTGAPSAASNSVTPQAPQTITFSNPGPQNFGATPTLTATASSGLPLTFSSSTPAVCSITSAGVLTTVTTGNCTINADQAGTAAFTAAPRVSNTFSINAVVPDAPVIGTATPGNRQAIITFSAPAFTGGAPIINYTATANPDGLTGISVDSPITIIGLTNGTAYTFTVTASNQAGTGAASAPTNSVIPPVIPGDCDFNGIVTIAEVQGAINMFLRLKGVEECVDIDKSGNVSISEVQKAINRFLGL